MGPSNQCIYQSIVSFMIIVLRDPENIFISEKIHDYLPKCFEHYVSGLWEGFTRRLLMQMHSFM